MTSIENQCNDLKILKVFIKEYVKRIHIQSCFRMKKELLKSLFILISKHWQIIVQSTQYNNIQYAIIDIIQNIKHYFKDETELREFKEILYVIIGKESTNLVLS